MDGWQLVGVGFAVLGAVTSVIFLLLFVKGIVRLGEIRDALRSSGSPGR